MVSFCDWNRLLSPYCHNTKWRVFRGTLWLLNTVTILSIDRYLYKYLYFNYLKDRLRLLKFPLNTLQSPKKTNTTLTSGETTLVTWAQSYSYKNGPEERGERTHSMYYLVRKLNQGRAGLGATGEAKTRGHKFHNIYRVMWVRVRVVQEIDLTQCVL